MQNDAAVVSGDGSIIGDIYGDVFCNWFWIHVGMVLYSLHNDGLYDILFSCISH